MSTERARFCSAIMDEIAVKDRSEHSVGGWILCDPLCFAAAAYPELVRKSTEAMVEVETQGKATRGSSAIERKRPNPNSVMRTNCVLLDSFDMERFGQIFRQAVS